MTKEPGPQLQGRSGTGQLRFVLYDQSFAAGTSNSRQVRSHAARSGWNVRKQKWKKSNRADQASGSTVEFVTQTISQPRSEPARRGNIVPKEVEPKATRSKQSSHRRLVKRRKRNDNFLETVLLEEYPLWSAAGNAIDPFCIYPVTWKSVFGPLIDCWLSYVSPLWLGEIKHGWDTKQTLAFAHLPLEVSVKTCEPAAFYSTVALAASLLPPTHPLAPANAPRLSQILQTKAQETLNLAMADPACATNDSTIISIVTLAGLAVHCKQIEVVKTLYLPAFQRAVEQRDGLQGIARGGQGHAILARWLLWGDCVLTSMTDSARLFPEFEDPTKDSTNWDQICGKIDGGGLTVWFGGFAS